jgi:hypothetical protein
MHTVDPEHRLPLVDFWDPHLAGQLTDLRRERRGWIAGEFGRFTLRYRRSRLRDVGIDLEILDRKSGRRLRQDGSDSAALFSRLHEVVS